MYQSELDSLNPSIFYMSIKRLLESFIIILTLPIVIIIVLFFSVLIKIEDGGTVFYKQNRIGYKGKVFKIYKLRSMKQDSGVAFTINNDSRITRVGRFIRKTRIDELPQFLNVLKGEMSLIGPRAEFKDFAEELQKEIPNYHYRYLVKPGISGLAQVTQGYATGVEESKIKLEYDLYYIKNFSFALDVKIFFKTIKTVITGFGAR